MGIPILKMKDTLLSSIEEDLIDQQALTFQSDVGIAWIEEEKRKEEERARDGSL